MYSINPAFDDFDIIFGGESASSQWYTGNIDEIGLWSRKIEDSEVASLYNSGNGLAYPFVVVPRHGFVNFQDPGIV